MDGESEVDFSSNGVTPLWRRRSTPPLQLLSRSKPRPQSYQLLSAHRRPVTNGRTVSPDYRAASPRLRRPKSPLVSYAASGGSPKSTSNGTVASPAALLSRASRTPDTPASCATDEDCTGVTASKVSSPIANGLAHKTDSSGPVSQTGQPAGDLELAPSRLSPALPHKSSEQKLPLQRLPSQGNELPNPSVVLSTNSPAALKMGKQQIIPKSLASEIKLSKSNSQNVESHRRLLKVRSMVEGLGAPLGHEGEEGEVDNDMDSPGSLRRGLRSTSYRRAVVSGFDFDSPTSSKKKNRMSQPVLKAVMEDKEKFSSLGRIKKKILKGQGTFDGEVKSAETTVA